VTDNDSLFIYTFFRELTLQVRPVDGSSHLMAQNDADSRKGLPLGGYVDIDPHFGGEIPPPKKTIFGAWMGVFKQNGQNIESVIL